MILISVFLPIDIYIILLVVYGVYCCCIICSLDIYLFINLLLARHVNAF